MRREDLGDVFEGADDLDTYFELIAPDVGSQGPGTNPSTLNTPSVVITTFEKCEWMLNQIHPQYIILFDADLAAVRNIELYKAYNPGLPCKVFPLFCLLNFLP